MNFSFIYYLHNNLRDTLYLVSNLFFYYIISCKNVFNNYVQNN